MKRDTDALKKKLDDEQKEKAKLQREIKTAQDKQDLEVARQVLKALRSAGLDDETIKKNPVIRQSGYSLKELA